MSDTAARPDAGDRSFDGMAIECRGIGKTFALGEELSLGRSLKTIVGRAEAADRLWALNDVSFSVRNGDAFGIVGSNGSGKSTLTQIISGIAVPTTGRVLVRGRVLPLLEIGAGFHPELTGRENIALLGTILGLERAQISREMPRIAAFASVERHLDTALKRYSSGMQARLSFATAICYPADTYVFDEVLAVVDDSFRDQCMDELTRLNRSGRTVVFMSHDLDLVTTVCQQGVWLEKGRVRETGPMDEVAAAYSRGVGDAGEAG
jgi:ABC-type polysaccharide/polyol phosphate transport system ATPase subunit